jgi:hypothetical protein
MKNVILIVLFAVTACGGSDGGGAAGSKDLTKFTGAPWTGNLTTSIMCPGQAPLTASASFFVVYSTSTGGGDLEYTSTLGCLFRFIVTGNTANLSNGPVSCTQQTASGPVVWSYTSNTATSNDGHNLTINGSGTASAGGGSCPTTTTGVATR